MNKGKYYISTAIAYTSGKPHIGNTYEIVLADSIARFKRLNGYEVYFQTGTDEHGQKIQQKAEERGITPRQFVDEVAGEIKRIWDLMNTSYDRFIRTTDPAHEAQVQKIFKYLYDKGDIYKGTYEGMYCVPCESFFTPSQLVDGKCPDCGRECVPAKEEAYFFKLSKYADRLSEYIDSHPDFIQPETRKNEMINNFLKPGLQDLCVSRSSFSWGVPVPFDPKHVIYVWIDALSNYITFPGYDVDGDHGETYKNFWPADVHLIGKDILRFHTLYWPILLMALDQPLPKQIFGHPWLLMSDGKMSKSKGNVIYADELAELFGVDAVRYYVLHEMPFAADGSITHELMIERVNTNLVNILGNLVNRTVSMVGRYNGGALRGPFEPAPIDDELKELCLKTPLAVEKAMDTLHVADAIDEIFTLLRRANKYIDETTPWILGKDPDKAARLNSVLYNLCEAIRVSAVLLGPFLPETSGRILDQLNVTERDWESVLRFGVIPEGHTVGQPEILFARIDPQEKLKQIEAMKKPEKKEDEGEYVGIEDFQKLDLRAGKILSCDTVEGSDKLLVMQIDLGGDVRQIVSGIRKWYEPAALAGKTAIVIKNLKPVKLRGVESRGMLLTAEQRDGTVKVLFTDAEPGAKIK